VLNAGSQVDLDYARRTIGVTQADFEELCDFLEEQSYLDLFKTADNKLTNIRLTLRGRFFIKPDGSGGYKQQRVDENKTAKDITELQEKQLDLQEQNVLLTKVLAVGTAVAAVYGLIQIYEFWMCKHCDCFCASY